MMYTIFKTDNFTGKTINICGGSHETEKECRSHWQAYMYGFYDQAVEILGSGNFQFMNGKRLLSFHFHIDGKKDVEYFMLLGDEGPQLIHELCKAGMI